MLTGRVAHIGLDSLVLDVGGVGYLVRTTPQSLTATRHGAELTLHTEMVVREDSMTLYGFATSADAEIFRMVQTVSGVGPRTALAVLAVMSPDDLRSAVASGDVKAITRVPGIGPKVAQRMLLELKDKIGSPVATIPERDLTEIPAGAGASAIEADVIEALMGLGWPEKAASSAVSTASRAGVESSGALLRAALRELGGHR